jgi:hypothetical protein
MILLAGTERLWYKGASALAENGLAGAGWLAIEGDA